MTCVQVIVILWQVCKPTEKSTDYKNPSNLSGHTNPIKREREREGEREGEGERGREVDKWRESIHFKRMHVNGQN